MHIRRTVTSFSYKIESKPEGGFIARSSDPSIPSLEAETREELQKQIQAKVASVVSAETGGLGSPFGNKEISLRFNPKANFSLHADGTGGDASPERIEEAAELLGGIVGANFPELSAALAAQKTNSDSENNPTTSLDVAGQEVKVKITTQRFGGRSFQAGQNRDEAKLPDGTAGFANSPITPEAGSFGRVLGVLAAILIAAAVMYLLVYRH